MQFTTQRSFRLVLALAAGLFACASAALAQSEEPPRDRPPIPTEGFWPTQRMVDRFINRITEDVAVKYEMDDEQLEMTRRLIKERYPAWMEENRAEIQTLVNQFFEAQLNDEAPEVEHVAAWAQRALPLMTKFHELTEQTTASMREYLTDDQVVKLEGDIAAFNVGFNMARGKITNWAEGNYDPETEWARDPRVRARRDQDERNRAQHEMDLARARAIAEGQPPPAEAAALTPPPPAPTESGATAGAPPAARPGRPTPPAVAAKPKDEWEKYVDDFIKRYSLTLDQQQKAQSYLRQLQRERDDMLRRNEKKFADVRERMNGAKTDDDRKRAAADFTRLNAPIETLFTKLKEKLDTIPTREQKKQAAERGAAPATPAPAPTTPPREAPKPQPSPPAQPNTQPEP